jgi:hypothetical protein
MRRIPWVLAACALAALVLAAPAAASDTSGLVSVGSPQTPFSQNKQNEPAIAVDQLHPNLLAQGANDNIDLEACNAGDDTTCPFTPGVGVSGLSFSLDGGSSWRQPTYSGYSARTCLGVVGSSDPDCTPLTPAQGGLIGTLPWYYENDVVSDGDPALAFGPVQDANGDFSWVNGSRLYYANLTSNFASKRRDFAIKGVEGIGVSRTDNATAAANDSKAAWEPPVLIPSTSGAAFADKEQIWADNASSSPHFGNAYLCYANYRGGPSVGSAAHDLLVATSRNGGDTWSRVQVAGIPGSASGRWAVLSGASGCTIRTASDGTVYVFWLSWNQRLKQNGIYMSTSTNGGATFSPPRRLFQVVHTGVYDPVQGRNEMDGITGARDDLSDAPSVDIANGAPTGAGATDQIVMTWVDGKDGLNNEHVMFTTSTDGGQTWTTPLRMVEEEIGHPSDRGFYSAPAISPNGEDVYLVYNAFLEPYKTSAIGPTNDRPLVGVVTHADVAPNGTVGPFAELNRGASGDARGSSANALTDEFLGDYVYAVATNDYGAAVWNDVRRAADCPAVDAYRMSLETGATVPTPAPEQDCPVRFGNTDIFGGAWADPTP